MSKKNKHIVILTPGFPENETDSTCIPALQIYVKALREVLGFEISIISLHYPKRKSVYHWNGIPVYTLGGSAVISKMLLWHRVYRLLKQIHLNKPITTLHSFWLGECALIGHWFCTKNKIRHVTTLMGQDALKGNKYAKILPLKKMAFISLSPFHQKTFSDNYNIKTEIIPWGISPTDFQYSTEKTIDIIGVGSLISLKNYDLFVDVIAEINKTKSIKTVIVGGGVLFEKLKDKIRSCNLEDTITLKGELPYYKTMQYLAQSKILLHTSDYESFGLVFPEALQNKAMVISKNIGCTFETQNWTIANTKTEMVEACEKMLSKSFSEIEKNPFLINKTVEHYLKIYDN